MPNGERYMFLPLSATLIYGQKDAVLTEAPLTTAQGKAVGDWIAASGKNLTDIYARKRPRRRSDRCTTR